ncbi:MAG TPA: hypothetical protein VIO14_12290 [Dehalococcoidia bacterium]
MTARTWLPVAAACLALLALACDAADDRRVPPLPPEETASSIDLARLRFCGLEDQGLGTGPDMVVRRCVWEAYQRGEPVEFVTRQITEEGAPVTTTYTLLAPDRVLVYQDSQDRFGRFGIFRSTCTGVEPDPRDLFRFTGCSEPVPEAGDPAPEGGVRECGIERYGHGQGLDRAARECLWQAYQAGRPAVFSSLALTDEGDPISTRYLVTRSGEILLRRDATQDRFGPPGVYLQRCAGLQRDGGLVWLPVSCSQPTRDPAAAVTPGPPAPVR